MGLPEMGSAQHLCLLAVMALASVRSLAADVRMYDDGQVAVWGRADLAGVGESPVPTYYGGVLQGSFEGIEAYDLSLIHI